MSNGSLDYSHLKDREILILLVQKVDGAVADIGEQGKRITSLERWRSWFGGVGSVISAGLVWLEARRH